MEYLKKALEAIITWLLTFAAIFILLLFYIMLLGGASILTLLNPPKTLDKPKV